MPVFPPPLPYRSSMEWVAPDEADAIASLEALFLTMAKRVAEQEGHAYRAVHAKGQALLKGTLTVAAGLPDELSQGLFAEPAVFPALLRVSSPPAEQLPDAVSTPRAIALKVMDVGGERADPSFPHASQDFLMVNGPAFTSPDPAGFLRAARLLAATTERMPRTKKLISAALRATEAALESAGGESAKLKGMGGEPRHHPLGETYFTQVPFLYGHYVAKFSLAPSSDALRQLERATLPSGDDAQRDAIQDFFSLPQGAEWELRVQLCRDIARMPVEDASVRWDEALSPWQTVARLRVEAQCAWSAACQAADDALAFSPWNALSAHRPLGGINRARKVVMAASREHRATANGCDLREPGGRKDGGVMLVCPATGSTTTTAD